MTPFFIHKLDGYTFRPALLLLLITTLWFLPACDDTPIVGEGLSPDDVKVEPDTVYLSDISKVSAPSFSGNRPFVSSGQIEDPLFGNTEAWALLKPAISRADGDTIVENPQAHLRLNIDNIHGTGTGHFEIVEIDRSWRSSSWRYDSIPDLSDRVVAEFTVDGPDSLKKVPLQDQAWINEYRSIFLEEPASVRDSLYSSRMSGLAIVASPGTNMIFSAQMQDTRLVFENPESDTLHLEKNISSWAISLDSDIGPEQDLEHGVALLNTMGSMLKLDFSFTEDFLGAEMFSRMELVLYEDTLAMQAQGISRPRSETSRLFFLEEEDLDFAIASDPLRQVNRDESDHSYRFNITNFATDRIYGAPATGHLYVAYGFNDGRILPMLFGDAESSEFRPRILINRVSQE